MLQMVISTFIAFNLILGECLIMFGYYKKKKLKAVKKTTSK